MNSIVNQKGVANLLFGVIAYTSGSLLFGSLAGAIVGSVFVLKGLLMTVDPKLVLSWIVKHDIFESGFWIVVGYICFNFRLRVLGVLTGIFGIYKTAKMTLRIFLIPVDDIERNLINLLLGFKNLLMSRFYRLPIIGKQLGNLIRCEHGKLFKNLLQILMGR